MKIGKLGQIDFEPDVNSLAEQYADLSYVIMVHLDDGVRVVYGTYSFEDVNWKASELREEYPGRNVEAIVFNEEGVYSGGGSY